MFRELEEGSKMCEGHDRHYSHGELDVCMAWM